MSKDIDWNTVAECLKVKSIKYFSDLQKTESASVAQSFFLLGSIALDIREAILSGIKDD